MEKVKKNTVLVIDDSATIRHFFRNVLETNGYIVLEAEDGKKGLQMAKKKKPDLILLDLILPELDGFGVLKKIRASRVIKAVPVVLLSTMGDRDKVQEALELGADDYAVKGTASPREVLGKIGSLISRADTQRSSETYRLSVKEGRNDAARMEYDVGLAKPLKCPDCDGEVLLELFRDESEEEGHWFSAHFICLECEKDF
jgi:DNA-binding response OmpR family regulator